MYYKVLKNGISTHGGNLAWSLPTQDAEGNWTPGAWQRVAGDIIVCQNGLHLTTEPYEWYMWGGDVYEAEGRGNYSERGNKVAYREARLLRPVEDPHWLANAKIFISSIPDIPFFIPDGNPLPNWMVFDTRDAARSAARSAAWDAAWDAARSAAWDAAWDAAWSAAWDAAWDAARDAALYVQVACICGDLGLEPKHYEHTRNAWDVWQKGYGLYAVVGNLFYVYKKP